MDRSSPEFMIKAALLFIATALATWLIVGLLIAVSRSPGNPNKERALLHVRQLSLALQAYAQDYDGLLPGWKEVGGNLYHNVWDEQLAPYVTHEKHYRNGLRHQTGIRSLAQEARQTRVLTYGLNGALLVDSFGDSLVAEGFIPANRRIWSLKEIGDPSNTIVLAELVTEKPQPAPYGEPAGAARPPQELGGTTRAFQQAQLGWIDIAPRDFVVRGQSGDARYSDDDTLGWGVARGLYGGGGCYAFADGSVRFQRLIRTVGFGQTGVTLENAWNDDNPHNQWNPHRAPVQEVR
jgi:hypothetical protein